MKILPPGVFVEYCPGIATHSMTNSSPQFYTIMGRFLARREIVKELGAPLWDDDGKLWWVAFVNGKVGGFAAVRGPFLCSAFVLPEYRGKGVYRALVDVRLRETTGSLRAVATDAATHALSQAGFRFVETRGRFSVMRLSR